MAARLSGHELSDLCLGKPALRSLSVSDTVADALAALKRIDDSYVSVWNCHHSFVRKQPQKQDGHTKCTCIGKVCMLDIICFLSKPQNLSSPAAALHSPVSALLPDNSALVRHLHPTASLVEAIDVMYEGVQNLVIPIQNQFESNNLHNNNSTYCWLTQEDVFRYLLNSIGVFSPTPGNPINTLGVIDTQNLFAVCYDDPASSALDLLALSLVYQSSVAIVDPHGKFVGEISPFMLNSCDESVVPAMATLSAGDLTAYVDCGGPPEDLVQLVKERVGEHSLSELLGDETGLSSWSSFSSSCSSDDEVCSGKNWKLGGYSGRVARRAEAIVCYRWSSLVAVMIQALAHRVSYVWVVEEDGTLTGIVTFQGMLKVFRDHLK
ncbi:CBS domain-containing protein CBSX5 [Spatholobus suberectus]|nr:CBS domain-containing protein CBSX5 [Spatholobus suberectus]